MKKRPICLLGGHLSPAQAVAEMLVREYKDVPILFIGRSYTFSSYNQKAVELQVMEAFGEVVPINPPRSYYPWYWFSFLYSFFTVFFVFLTRRPRVIISFGSYVALPGVVAAGILRIPLIVHEQTRSISDSNAFASKVAKVVCVTDDDVDVAGLKAPIEVTGFPLRPSLFQESLGAAFSVPSRIPIILITGGTSGAVSINELLFPIVKELLTTHVIIHQTGDISYAKAQVLQKELPLAIKSRYIIEKYISAQSMHWVYKNATLVISRSGANTVHELSAFHKQAILIPLPDSKKQEQQHLAEWYVKKHSGVVLEQHGLTSKILLDQILKQKPVLDISPPIGDPLEGTKKMLKIIETYIS